MTSQLSQHNSSKLSAMAPGLQLQQLALNKDTKPPMTVDLETTFSIFFQASQYNHKLPTRAPGPQLQQLVLNKDTKPPMTVGLNKTFFDVFTSVPVQPQTPNKGTKPPVATANP